MEEKVFFVFIFFFVFVFVYLHPQTNLRKMYQPTRKKIYKRYFVLIAVCLITLIGIYAYTNISGGPRGSRYSKDDILNLLQQQAMIATTEVEVKKLGEYNTAKSEEKFSLSDPQTWKWGERVCIVPVELTLKYGIDLTKLTRDDIDIEDGTVTIYLPQPTIVDSEYRDEIKPNEIFSMTTGAREVIAHEEQEAIAEQTFRSVVNDKQITESLAEDIRRNTRQVFSSIIRSMGLTPNIQFKQATE